MLGTVRIGDELVNWFGPEKLHTHMMPDYLYKPNFFLLIPLKSTGKHSKKEKNN
jgi:hypothetical protein